MFVVIFEVQPKAERWNDYLEIAQQLRPKLEAIEGFIDNERFESNRMKGRLLSLSTWRDEKALVRWRTQADHHGAQERGRFEVFEDYHLRVGEVTADSAPPLALAVEVTRSDETQIAQSKVCTLTEGFSQDALAQWQFDKHAPGLLGHDVFHSISNPGKAALLASWRDESSASLWKPAPTHGASEIRHRRVRVIRDYGMSERHEAPQFFRATHESRH